MPMKRALSSIILIIAAGALTAPAAVLNPVAQLAAEAGRSRADAAEYVPMIVRVADDVEMADLEAHGAIVMRRRDDLALLWIPRSAINALADTPGVLRAEASIASSPMLDISCPSLGVDDVHSGAAAEGVPYTGKGVLIGLTDLGFDPGHPNFDSRVVGLSNYHDTSATVDRAVTAEEIAAWTTDCDEDYHATHVAGIAAGTGAGTAYGGVAPDASIFVSTSMLYDACICAGVEDIIDAADARGVPAVVNMSLGSPIGPHDGTDLMCQYLEKCGEEAAIVMSVGNSGTTPMSLCPTFTQERPSSMTIISDCVDWDFMNLCGYLDAWSADERPFGIRFRVLDIDTQTFVYDSPVMYETCEWSSDNDPGLAPYLTGSVRVATEANPDNGRYNALAYLDMHCSVERDCGPWARYNLCVELSGEPGVHVDLCADCERLQLWFPSGLQHLIDYADASMSFSSMSCTRNATSVGSNTTRNWAPLAGGGNRFWGLDVDVVTPFTSWGTTIDGRSMPHFCAPGAVVVSSMSRPFIDKHPGYKDVCTAIGTDCAYFYPMTGTSMSAPHVTGIYALWLEADPTLTSTELRQIAIETASTTAIDLTDPRSGAGVIDAAAGLRRILNLQGVADVALDHPDTAIEWYDLQGNHIAEPQSPGIYIRRSAAGSAVVFVK